MKLLSLFWSTAANYRKGRRDGAKCALLLFVRFLNRWRWSSKSPGKLWRKDTRFLSPLSCASWILGSLFSAFSGACKYTFTAAGPCGCGQDQPWWPLPKQLWHIMSSYFHSWASFSVKIGFGFLDVKSRSGHTFQFLSSEDFDTNNHYCLTIPHLMSHDFSAP